MRIIFISDNYMGGVNSLNRNLMNNKPDAAVEQWAIPVDCRELNCSRAVTGYNADKVLPFYYTRKANYSATIRRLRRLIPDEPGALILNDFLEMLMLDHFPVQQTVYQLIHDDYYVRLAQKYPHIVDVFITHNLDLYHKLLAGLPQRKEDIFFLPHGVTIPPFFRKPESRTPGKLRLLFLARMVESKGIFDLIAISELLRQAGCSFEWTCIGRGPDLAELQRRWNQEVPVAFLSPDTNEEVVKIASEHDVFVLPTKFDGTPVSLLETMSVGLVPVITDLPGGIREIVGPDIGFALPMNDNAAFARAIEKLAGDRDLLDRLGKNARKKAEAQFDIRMTSRAYYDKFLAYREHFHPKTLKKAPIGSRLDHPLIPSFVTIALRSLKNQE